MPLERFWLLSRNIDRIKSEDDIRRLQTARVAQATAESYAAFEKSLQQRLGQPVVTKKVLSPFNVEADPDAELKLRKIFGRG
ncbi:hypothetical protein KKJ09_13240 [Xenorhabdus bovienii]|uniref:hypothetical protein n=1 Tax=Xenorhabdus bovienii TaxID=40576 RepID=UPI0023B21421|nr:hypothetical protein [Xenorhabdus bovienii]MDE9494524.1 hypothetical protein [Xenorhabdus bovienii]MDE9502921.1 hypothetical protein [Xenorhabdus bovienii]MDE9526571.1 hypothetical protein [Xenorhabdus bovienii]MDE9568830.1 hypothetical protein [Xenorhabdus bovienii]